MIKTIHKHLFSTACLAAALRVTTDLNKASIERAAKRK